MRAHFWRRRRLGGDRARWFLGWRQSLAFGFDFELCDFRGNLRFELIRSALKLIERFADLTCNLWQFLGPKDEQGQEEQEDGLGKTH